MSVETYRQRLARYLAARTDANDVIHSIDTSGTGTVGVDLRATDIRAIIESERARAADAADRPARGAAAVGGRRMETKADTRTALERAGDAGESASKIRESIRQHTGGWWDCEGCSDCYDCNDGHAWNAFEDNALEAVHHACQHLAMRDWVNVQLLDARAHEPTAQRVRAFMELLEREFPPPFGAHHSLTFARYGSDEVGWTDQLCLQVWRGREQGEGFQRFFIDRDELDRPHAVTLDEVRAGLQPRTFPQEAVR